MYFWLFTLTMLIWLWLSGGVVAGWRRNQVSWFAALIALGFLGACALGVLLIFGPYAMVVYSVLLQPA